MLARAAAAGEERLQRLRGELDDAIAVDPSGPAALEVGLPGTEHAESHGSVWTITSAISGCSRRMSSSISLARAWASSRLALAVEAESEERDEADVGAQEAQLARRPARRLAHDPLDRGRVDALLARLRRLGERLEVRLHRVDLGRRGEDRVLELLGDVVRLLERHLARQLEVQRELEPAADVDEREVVDLAHARHGQRGGVRALAHARILERLDVHDDVAARQRPLDCLLDRVRGGVALADRVRSTRRRSRRRRTGGRRPGASAAGAARPPASPPRSPRARRPRRRSGARSMSTSMLLRIRRAAASEHEHGDEERRDRVAVRVAGPRDQQADEHGDRAREVAAEVQRVRRERRARVPPRRAPARRSSGSRRSRSRAA